MSRPLAPDVESKVTPHIHRTPTWASLNTIAGFALTLATVAHSSDAPQTLCKPQESVVMSCSVQSGKIVSLCASDDLGVARGYMQYRYGRPTSVELTFPGTEVPLPSGFKYFESQFAKGGTLAISF
jgi:hypothetical protein